MKRVVEHFLWIVRACPKDLEGPSNLFLCVSEKSRTTHQSDYMSRKVKKLRFWKNEAQNQVHIHGSPRAFTFHCEFKLGKDICDYSLHTFSTCFGHYYFSFVFFIHVFFAHVTCSIDLFSVQEAILSQKKMKYPDGGCTFS